MRILSSQRVGCLEEDCIDHSVENSQNSECHIHRILRDMLQLLHFVVAYASQMWDAHTTYPNLATGVSVAEPEQKIKEGNLW